MISRVFAIRVSLFFLFLFFGMGIQLPFLPLWLADKGLSAPDIAFILAAQIAIRLISAPIGAFLADRLGNRRAMIIWGASLAAAGYALLCLAQGFWMILLAALLAGSLFSMIVPLAESFAVDGAFVHKLDYGRLRLWGTVSFMAGNIVAGALLEVIAVSNVIYMITLAQLMLAGVAFSLPDDPSSASRQDDAPKLRVADAFNLFSSPVFVVFIAAVSLGQASHAVYYGFGSVHWNALGYSESVIGILWLVGGVAEVLVFAVSGRAALAVGPVLVIVAGTMGGALRWFVTATDPWLPVLFCAQTLHAFSFTLTHLGTMLFIQQAVSPALRNTAQGVYAAVSGGLVMSLVTVFSGPLYRDYGGGAYLAMAALSTLASLFALLLLRLSPRVRAEAQTS